MSTGVLSPLMSYDLMFTFAAQCYWANPRSTPFHNLVGFLSWFCRWNVALSKRCMDNDVKSDLSLTKVNLKLDEEWTRGSIYEHFVTEHPHLIIF